MPTARVSIFAICEIYGKAFAVTKSTTSLGREVLKN
jgi:hypothetical protein